MKCGQDDLIKHAELSGLCDVFEENPKFQTLQQNYYDKLLCLQTGKNNNFKML
jgi:hypothetical protein